MSLVDVNDVLNILMSYCSDDDGTCSNADVDLREMLDEVENLPAIEPIKHGHWINRGDNCWECSECHELSCCVGNYCMDCGAKMEVME